MVRPLFHPILLVLVSFSLIGTPMTYRGGASEPHPHTFLEFLMEARAGNFQHHHGVDTIDEHDHIHEHAQQTHDHDQGPDLSAPTPNEMVMTYGGSLSAFVVGDVGSAGVVLPQRLWVEPEQITAAPLRDELASLGIVLTPPSPPPR